MLLLLRIVRVRVRVYGARSSKGSRMSCNGSGGRLLLMLLRRQWSRSVVAAVAIVSDSIHDHGMLLAIVVVHLHGSCVR